MTSRIVFAFSLALFTSACTSQVTSGSGGGQGGSSGSTEQGSGGSRPGAGGSSGDGGTQSSGGGGAAAEACTANSDCAKGDICVYAIKEACSARGTCEPYPTPEACQAIGIAKACGCDGSEVDWTIGCAPNVPDGFAPAPIAHLGACDTKAQCTTSADCTPANGYTPPEGFTHGECAYPQIDGCAAQGECFDPFPMCNSLVDIVGCACDGTRVDMGCGYPGHVYAPKPLAHLGPCDTGP